MKAFSSHAVVIVGIVLILAVIPQGMAAASLHHSSDARTRSTHGISVSAPHAHHDHAAYNAARRNIQATFFDAIRRARRTLVNALRSASTSAQRITALRSFDESVVRASEQRSVALIELGSLTSNGSPTHRGRRR